MKVNIFLITFLTVFNIALAEDTTMKNETCKNLSNKVSFEAFSEKANAENYIANNIDNTQGIKYIGAVKTALAKQMNNFCETKYNKVTIDDFKNEYHAKCSSTCQDNTDIFKGLTAKSKKDNADLACLTVCNNSYRKLELVEKGIKLAAAQEPQGTTANCDNAVSNTSRNAVKPAESGTKKIETKKATSK